MEETKEKGLKAGEDGVCMPKDYEGPSHSLESLRCLAIAYFFMFEWLLWDPYFVSHGSFVASVLGVELVENVDMPLLDFARVSDKITNYLPSLTGERVLVLVHPSLVDRSLGIVSLPCYSSLDYLACEIESSR
jgi:hypothetical protein